MFSFVFLVVFCALCAITSSSSCVGDQLLGLVLFIMILYNVSKRYSHYASLLCIAMVVAVVLIYLFFVVHHRGGFFSSSSNVLLCM
jgi:uncharacterized membrane protein